MAGAVCLSGVRRRPGCAAEEQSLHLPVRRCGRQTSVTAATIMCVSKLLLTIWFWVTFFDGDAPHGISALQLQNRPGLGSYCIALILCAKPGQRNVRRHRAKRDRVLPAGKVLIKGVSGNLPDLRSEGAEHESPEFLLAKVLDHLQPSAEHVGHCLVGLDQAA